MTSSNSKLLDEFIEAMKNHPEYKDKILNVISPDEYVKRDEMSILLEEIIQFRIDSNKRFNKVFNRLDDLSISLGHDFEEFNSLWLNDFLNAQGYPSIQISKKTFYDEKHEVFPKSKEVEIDIFNEDPLVIGEVTAITKSLKKVNDFLKKVIFISHRFGKPHMLVYITYGFKPEIRNEAMKKLEENNVKIYTLRQKQVEELID